jgi:hypothetical protein
LPVGAAGDALLLLLLAELAGAVLFVDDELLAAGVDRFGELEGEVVDLSGCVALSVFTDLWKKCVVFVSSNTNNDKPAIITNDINITSGFKKDFLRIDIFILV